MSATETEKEDATSRELGRQHLLGSAQTERGERVARAGANGPRRRVGLPGRKRGGEVNSFFFFLFNYFKAFSNDFESYFEFESNHSSQKFKCNIMSAQTCFYPYI
jgi:hypothetical protein